MKRRTMQEVEVERLKAESDLHLVIRHGPDAPPLAEQMGLDVSTMRRDDVDYCETAQMVLHGIAETIRHGGASSTRVNRLRKEVTERMVARFFPNDVIHGSAHYDRDGRLLS